MVVSNNSMLRNNIPMKKSQYFAMQDLPTTYWRTNFMLCCLPLIAWGIPTHLIFRRRQIETTKEWLTFLCPCSSPCSSLLTFVLVLLTIAYNCTFVYMIGYFFYVLLFTGELDAQFVECGIQILRNLPIIVPLNIFWIKGYSVRNCVASFDKFTLSISTIDTNGAIIKPPPGCRVKMFLVYIILIVAHVLHFLIQSYSTDISTLPNKSPTQTVWSVVFEYSTAILLTMIFPIYCTFCWAVNYQLNLFFEYVKVLISTQAAPKYEHFDEFKRCYRKIADDIMFVNQMFAIYLSVIFLIVGQLIFGELENLGMRLINIVMEIFTKDEETGSKAQTQALSLPEIRMMVGACIILLCYFGLFGFTFWQAVLVNDNVRYLHVWINDFVSEPVSRIPTDLYEAFTLLKWYIHSRLEQERPALLNIMAVNLVPFLAARLRQYRVRH
ncbi:hypothetical protein Bhyg_12377 [Pseudolycoriella hygida]|uniref:Uncharacterized protein n=1 Tax=Pseudolycoriella hygida TaxID=35572 RepID=A0A9Q0RZ89_9DIPT|nr:hypothetical protein Bhyg_12377 [Pseudolycoriella hygida]